MTKKWRERSKAPPAARGYGAEHRRLRARYQRVIDAGVESVWCVRCGLQILPKQPFDLDHDDFDRSLYLGPAHRHCNRSAAAVKGNKLRAQRNPTRLGWFRTSREW